MLCWHWFHFIAEVQKGKEKKMLFPSVAAVTLATSVVECARSKHYLQARHVARTVTQHLTASKCCTNTNPAHLLPPQERQ